ncbi:MAG: hypothetical protein WC572_01965 [Candidatus Omnitrophota bacterium]
MMRCIGKVAGVYLIAAGMLLVSWGAVFAQQGGRPPAPPSAKDIVSKMEKELDLSEEQVKQVTRIMEEEMEQAGKIMSSAVDLDSARVKMDALRQDTESKLSQYLTGNQMEQWKNREGQQPIREGPEKASFPANGKGSE